MLGIIIRVKYWACRHRQQQCMVPALAPAIFYLSECVAAAAQHIFRPWTVIADNILSELAVLYFGKTVSLGFKIAINFVLPNSVPIAQQNDVKLVVHSMELHSKSAIDQFDPAVVFSVPFPADVSAQFLDSQWVFDLKECLPIRMSAYFKPCIIANGLHQLLFFDCHDVHILPSSLCAIQMLLAIAVENAMAQLHLYDTAALTSAHFHSDQLIHGFVPICSCGVLWLYSCPSKDQMLCGTHLVFSSTSAAFVNLFALYSQTGLALQMTSACEYIGLNIIWDRQARLLYLSQAVMIDCFLAKHFSGIMTSHYLGGHALLYNAVGLHDLVPESLYPCAASCQVKSGSLSITHYPAVPDPGLMHGMHLAVGVWLNLGGTTWITLFFLANLVLFLSLDQDQVTDPSCECVSYSYSAGLQLLRYLRHFIRDLWYLGIDVADIFRILVDHVVNLAWHGQLVLQCGLIRLILISQSGCGKTWHYSAGYLSVRCQSCTLLVFFFLCCPSIGGLCFQLCPLVTH